MNLLSAAATIAAAVITARLVARWTGDVAGAIGGALLAGTMSTAWLNATETEVYALSLLLSVLALAAAERSGRDRSWKWLLGTSYFLMLSVPLHLSAIVVVPAAMVLAARPIAGGKWDPAPALLLTGVAVLAVGASRASVIMLAMGAVLAAAGAAAARGPRSTAGRIGRSAAIVAVSAVALSALVFMLVRAAHDPGLNQGDPSTVSRWLDVIARRQYTVSPLWPRQAPLWLQLANVGQYADWQFALGASPEPYFSAARVIATLAFVSLAVHGAAAHRRADRDSWIAVLALLAAGTVGVALQLNMKAGPSIGWGILPDTAPHEPRERDYFFVLGFWAWGVWAGVGAAALLRRWRPRWAAFAPLVAVIPIALNWRIADRSREPRASLAPVAARAFLASAPANAVLFTAGDNDTYPVWFAQLVERYRPDVTPVVIPLLGADWYRAELARRHALLDGPDLDEWRGFGSTIGAIGRAARARGRPLAATVAVEPDEWRTASVDWRLNGWIALAEDAGSAAVRPPEDSLVAAVREIVRLADARVTSLTPAEEYVVLLLSCGEPMRSPAVVVPANSLASLCNYR